MIKSLSYLFMRGSFMLISYLCIMKYNENSIAKLHSKFIESSGICTDTRKIEDQCLFVALVGENFDGNTYAHEALSKGAKFALVSESRGFAIDPRFIIVEDTLATLQQLANYHRKFLNIPIFSITGSNGKTTTKELCAAILGAKYNVAFTYGNLNNHIGVPLTLLSFDSNVEFGIVEMGANHRGEIAALCKIAEPNFGLITNIGKAHIGEFGGTENIRIAKLEMFDYIKKSNGKMFYNMMDNALSETIAEYNGAIPFDLTFTNGCKIIISEIEPTIKLKLNFEDKTTIVAIEIGGVHNVENIKAGIAIGLYFGLDPKEIKEQLEEFRAPMNRSQWLDTSRNKVFLDAYNANPNSVEQAINYFIKIKADRKLIILGDMNELGEYSDAEHLAIYEKLEESKLDFYLVGQKFELACQVKRDNRIFREKANFQSFLEENRLSGKTILIKASRGLRLESLVSIL